MLKRVLVLSALLRTALSQHTEAVCNVTSLNWSFNSINQSPCLVAAYLANPCTFNSDFDVPAIGPGIHYVPPILTSICVCNTVIYSLLSACALCQGADVDPWSDYTTNCTQSSIAADGTYIPEIQVGTAVPHWAYQLVQGTNRFNATLAKLTGDQPENFTAPTTTSSSASSTSTGPSGSPTPPSSPSPSQTHSSSSNHTGAIVGGVVGGIGGIALIGGIFAFWLMRSKKKDESADTARASMVYYPPSSPGQQYTPDPTKTPGSGYGTGWPQQTPYTGQPGGFRPYNPDDPSTFPPEV